MSREKQIIEIKECIDEVYGQDCAYYDVDGFAIANEIYNAGYRKASEVAREIFEELEVWLDGSRYSLAEMVWGVKHSIEELKKKYTEEVK